jgi:hypothetical protein
MKRHEVQKNNAFTFRGKENTTVYIVTLLWIVELPAVFPYGAIFAV